MDDGTGGGEGPRAVRPAVPLVLSSLLGAAGLVCLLVGAVVGGDVLFVTGAAFGALSLGAALYWRSELISSWRAGGAGRRPGGPAR